MVDEEELRRILSSGNLITIGNKTDELINKNIIVQKKKEINIVKPEKIDTYNDEVGLNPNIRTDPIFFLTFNTIFTTIIQNTYLNPLQKNNVDEILNALEKTEFDEIKTAWKTYETQQISDWLAILQGLKLLLDNYKEQDYTKLKDSVKKKMEKDDFNFATSFKISVFNEVPPVIYSGCLAILQYAKNLSSLSKDERKKRDDYLALIDKYDFNTLKKSVGEQYTKHQSAFKNIKGLKIEENMIEAILSVVLLFRMLDIN